MKKSNVPAIIMSALLGVSLGATAQTSMPMSKSSTSVQQAAKANFSRLNTKALQKVDKIEKAIPTHNAQTISVDTPPVSKKITEVKQAVEGGVNAGGGDGSAERILAISRMIGIIKDETNRKYSSKTAKIKEKLISLINILKILPTPAGEIGEKIQTAIANDIIEDIQNANYNLTSYCEDSATKTERSASTQDVDRSLNKSIQIPDICINARRMALENLQESQIVGLLFHEHMRHFGHADDTDELGFHPMASAIKLLYDATHAGIGTGILVTSNSYLRKFDSNKFGIVSKDITKVKIKVENLKGDCEIAVPKIKFPRSSSLFNLGSQVLKQNSSPLVFTEVYPDSTYRITGFKSSLSAFINPEAFGNKCSATLVLEEGNQKILESAVDLSMGQQMIIQNETKFDYPNIEE